MSGTIYQRDRSKNLWLSYKLPSGRRIRESAGTDDPVEAQKILQQRISRASELSFVDAVAEFFTVHAKGLKPSTLHGYKNSLRVLDPYFREFSLAQITVSDLKHFVSQRRAEVSDASVRRDLMFLSSVFSYAQEAIPGAPEINPVIQLKKKRLKEKKRDQFLTHADFLTLERACLLDWQRQVIRTAVYTGMRHSEIKNLRKSQVDFHRSEIILSGDQTKNAKPRIIPILPDLRVTLEPWCDTQLGDWVFGRYVRRLKTHAPFTTFQGFFKGARSRAGLENLRFHDLRHTFASWWMQEGGDIYVLKDILGHSSMQMVERYAHLDTGAARRAVEEFPCHTFGTLGKKS